MAISKTSIHDLTQKAARAIRKSLKERGIEVPEVDGPSTDQPELRGLQELQEIHRALDAADVADAERASEPRTGIATSSAFGVNPAASSSAIDASSVSTGTGSTGKK